MRPIIAEKNRKIGHFPWIHDGLIASTGNQAPKGVEGQENAGRVDASHNQDRSKHISGRE